MGKLKGQIIEDMKLKNFSPRTIKAYVSSITIYVRYFKVPPEELTEQHIKEYLSHLIQTGSSWSTINIVQSSLKQLYANILKQDWKVLYAIALQPICWKTAQIFSPSLNFWDILTLRLLLFIFTCKTPS